MKPKSTLRAFLCLAGSALFAVSSVSAETYYWDSNNETPGFGNTAGTWSATTLGTTTSGWSTDPTGATAIAGNSVTTTTADDIFFGTAALNYPAAITIVGTVDAKSMSENSANFIAGADPVINFGAEGSFETRRNNANLPIVTISGAGTSMTWFASRNMNVGNVTMGNVGKIVLKTSTASTTTYPGRTAMSASENLGPVGTPLEFDGGTLRLNSGFPYASLSALNADHPVSFVAGQNAGFDNQVPGSTFSVDLPIDLGTGFFYAEGNTDRTIRLTEANTMAGIYQTGGILEISESVNLGSIASPLTFGSGNAAELGAGILKITGTTMTSFGARPVLTTPGRTVAFEIADAANTFTVDKLLDQTTGGFIKNGPGTLVLTEANTYTGATTVSGGTLVINGDQSSATGNVTVEANGTLGGSGTIGGDTTIANNGKLTFDITTEAGSHDKLELASGKTLTFSGASTLTITSSAETPASGLYTLVTALGGTTQISGSVPTVILPDGWVADAPEIVADGSDTSLVLNITSVDGLSGYAAWKDANAGGQGPEEDFDNDGVKNGVEFFMNAPAGFTANPALDGTNTITWPNGGNIPASDYSTQFVIQTSPDLATWTDVPVGDLTTNTDGPAGSLTYTLTGAAPRFVRIKVTPN